MGPRTRRMSETIPHTQSTQSAQSTHECCREELVGSKGSKKDRGACTQKVVGRGEACVSYARIGRRQPQRVPSSRAGGGQRQVVSKSPEAGLPASHHQASQQRSTEARPRILPALMTALLSYDYEYEYVRSTGRVTRDSSDHTSHRTASRRDSPPEHTQTLYTLSD